MPKDPVIEKEIDKVISEKMSHLPEEKRGEMGVALKKIYCDGVSPKNAFKIDQDLLDFLYGYAYRLFKAGKFKDAEVAFLFLFEMDPASVKYAKALAFCYKEEKDPEMAALGFATWAILDPNDPIPPYYRAELALEHKKYEEAYLAYAESILKSLTNPVYKQLMERAHLNMQCLEERLFPEKAKS